MIEDGLTFEANALKKALQTSIATGMTTLADDSGLAVDALDGRPGVFSARYAGEDAGELDNNALLVRELAAVPAERRTARYVAVLCLALAGDDLGRRWVGGRAALPLPADLGDAEAGVFYQAEDRVVVWVRGECEGRIVDEARGEGGFGYDPHFFVDDWSATMAEVPLAKKNERSHRAVAVRRLAALLEQSP